MGLAHAICAVRVLSTRGVQFLHHALEDPGVASLIYAFYVNMVAVLGVFAYPAHSDWQLDAFSEFT